MSEYSAAHSQLQICSKANFDVKAAELQNLIKYKVSNPTNGR